MKEFHGIFSISLIFISILTWLLSMLHESLSMGLVYIVIISISSIITIYSFCSKCSCRLNSCGHILPGRLTKFLPSRKQGNYNFWDILGVAIAVTALVAFPQPWLFKNKISLTVFCVLDVNLKKIAVNSELDDGSLEEIKTNLSLRLKMLSIINGGCCV